MMICPLCASDSGGCLVQTPDGREYLKCAICGLVCLLEKHFLTGQQERERYLLHNNSVDIPEYRSYLGRLVELVVDRVKPEGRGLDYGCGPVEGMKAILSSKGFQVDPYDPLFYPRADLLRISYDFVLCNEAAEHFFRPAEEFATMDRVLKRGGILGIRSQLLPEPEAFPHWGYRRDPTHVCFYARETVAWLAARFQWEVLLIDNPFWVLRKP